MGVTVVTAADRDRRSTADTSRRLDARHAVLAATSAFAILAIAYFAYRFEEKGGGRIKAEKATTETPPAPRPLARPRPRDAVWAQLFERTDFEMGQVFRSPAFVVLILIGLFNSGGGLILGAELQGSALYPVTRWVINTLQGSFTLVVIVIAIFYAGELVWRERDRKTHEIVDATPAPAWTFIVPKTIALALVLLATLAISAIAGVAVQLSKGFLDVQLDKYVLWYVLPTAVDWIFIAVLAIFFQAVSPNKFVGWGLWCVYC